MTDPIDRLEVMLIRQESMLTTLASFVIAHSSELNEDEIMRFKLHIKDWLRIQS